VEDRTRSGGAFELTALAPSRYRLLVNTDRGAMPVAGVEVEVAAGATVERDLVLDDVATLSGTVVDADGAAVAGVQIHAVALDHTWSYRPGSIHSDTTGAFTIEGLRPGDYHVAAARSFRDPLRRPGTNDDSAQSERVSLRAGQTTTVRLVVEATSGAIRGTVLGATGKPVSDAFVSCARESDAAGANHASAAATRDDWWGSNGKPVLTATDGGFALGHLAPGAYTVRAYRKGGGEAIAEHIAVGATATLRIKPTGSIDGVARAGSRAPVTLRISARDPATGLARSESFFHTDGHFTMTDLPAGHFEVTAQGDTSQASITVDLGDGEARTNLSIALEPLVNVTGRVVQYGTQRPVAGMVAHATALHGGRSFRSDDDDRNVSDDAGRFTIANVAVGKVAIMLTARDQNTEYSIISAIRTLADPGTGTIDIGDLGVVRRRLKPGQPAGELGLHFAPPPLGAELDQLEQRITWIDPTGPAASSGLQLGDVITSVDSINIAGENASMFWMLTQAPPGTRLSLGTRRGPTVTIALAAP
jgi:protocatechuate 3,4-dioxygenase beta subunit